MSYRIEISQNSPQGKAFAKDHGKGSEEHSGPGSLDSVEASSAISFLLRKGWDWMASHGATLVSSDPAFAAPYVLLIGSADSLDSLSVLVQGAKYRDCLAIGRSVFETALNGLYILAKGGEESDRMMQHAGQKQYRDTDRLIKTSLNKLHMTLDNRTLPDEELKTILDEFTDVNGKEVRSWTKKSVDQRLEYVEQTFGAAQSLDLLFSFAVLYRHASEVLHGTVHGVLVGLGLYEGGITNKEEKLKSRTRLAANGAALFAFRAHCTFVLKYIELTSNDPEIAFQS